MPGWGYVISRRRQILAGRPDGQHLMPWWGWLCTAAGSAAFLAAAWTVLYTWLILRGD